MVWDIVIVIGIVWIIMSVLSFVQNILIKNIQSALMKKGAPILSTFHDLGVPAAFSGRNDLTIHGNKFSGNAQFRTTKKNDFTIIQFQEKILSKIQSLFPDCKNYVYTEQDQAAIETRVQKISQDFQMKIFAIKFLI